MIDAPDLHVLIFFDRDTPADIGLRASMTAYSRKVRAEIPSTPTPSGSELRRRFGNTRSGRDTGGMPVTNLMASILNWLRAGYPDGVPGPDQVPLLALLRATPLTEEQVQEVVRNIAEVAAPADIEDPITRDDIEASISEVTNHDAGPENTARVAARLAAAGWPLADLAEE